MLCLKICGNKFAVLRYGWRQRQSRQRFWQVQRQGYFAKCTFWLTVSCWTYSSLPKTEVHFHNCFISVVIGRNFATTVYLSWLAHRLGQDLFDVGELTYAVSWLCSYPKILIRYLELIFMRNQDFWQFFSCMSQGFQLLNSRLSNDNFS